MAFGEDGLIARAQQAKELTEEATRKEQESLNSLMEEFNEIMSGEGGSGTIPEEPEGPIDAIRGEIQDDTLKVENVPVDSDGDNPEETGTIYVPGGFGIDEESPNDINDGIVITDGTNEFVWIPVSEEKLGEMYVEALGTTLTGVETTTDLYSKLRDENTGEIMDTNRYKPGTTSHREPDVLSLFDTDAQYYSNVLGYNSTKEMADAFVKEYNDTYESIKEYGGFYIGRYELTGTVGSPTVQKGQTVLTNQNWYNLRKACSNVVNNEYAVSEMIYGNQWDRVLNWLVETGEKKENEVYRDSSSWGNYENYNDSVSSDKQVEGAGEDVLPAGSSDYWRANNIYDLAGNASDSTQEAYYTVTRISRGRYVHQFRFQQSGFLPLR